MTHCYHPSTNGYNDNRCYQCNTRVDLEAAKVEADQIYRELGLRRVREFEKE